MRRIQTILAVCLAAILFIAGPCPACPSPQPKASAHDCCPDGKTTKNAPSTKDCPLIAYYLDVTKNSKGTQQLLDVVADLPVIPDSQLTSALLTPVFSAASEPHSNTGPHLYLLHASFLI